jgi:hypothetical protein
MTGLELDACSILIAGVVVPLALIECHSPPTDLMPTDVFLQLDTTPQVGARISVTF